MPDDADIRRAPFWWPDTRSFIGIVLVFGAVGIAFVLIFRPVNDFGPVANQAIGSLFTLATMVVTFFFGSSRGSESKENTINAIASNAASTSNATNAANAAAQLPNGNKEPPHA